MALVPHYGPNQNRYYGNYALPAEFYNNQQENNNSVRLPTTTTAPPSPSPWQPALSPQQQQQDPYAFSSSAGWQPSPPSPSPMFYYETPSMFVPPPNKEDDTLRTRLESNGTTSSPREVMNFEVPPVAAAAAATHTTTTTTHPHLEIPDLLDTSNTSSTGNSTISTSYQDPFLIPHDHQLQPTRRQKENDIPEDIVASQERVLQQIRQQQKQQQQQQHSMTTATTRTMTNTTPTTTLIIPESTNPMGSDAIHPRKGQMKQLRQVNTVVGATTGAIVVGALSGPLFPIGMVVGGAAGGYACNKATKLTERRAQRKWEQNNYQQGIASSMVIQQDGTLV